MAWSPAEVRSFLEKELMAFIIKCSTDAVPRVCVCTCMCLCVYTYVFMYVYVYACMCALVCKHAYVHVPAETTDHP